MRIFSALPIATRLCCPGSLRLHTEKRFDLHFLLLCPSTSRFMHSFQRIVYNLSHNLLPMTCRGTSCLPPAPRHEVDQYEVNEEGGRERERRGAQEGGRHTH
eukprot:TRINITY_DN23168_c0_g1_i1.p2 TRINITY_DN23168_c0_g1~~TRINITY_DN23168_c0_g1_i1.p2  ORF type:complete len:102 (-),score=5.17 TRINITY_DN23168_c0_g1_i1:149-454(-)